MFDRSTGSLRRSLGIGALAVGAAIVLAALPAQAGRHHGGGGGHFRGGGFRGGFFHPHPFVFFGAGIYAGYYGFYPYPYPYPAYYPPPPVYVSPTDCYNTVPRGPGVADLYTCAGQYIGPIAVP